MRDWPSILAKWRTILTGWQLGTRPKGDPEADAVRDANEARLLLRADVNALTGLLIAKGVFTAEEYTAALYEECRLLSLDYETRFPGMRATEQGIDMKLPEAAETMARMGFKP